MPAIYAHDPFLLVQHLLAASWLDPLMLLFSSACEGWSVALVGVVWIAASERGRATAAWAAVALLVALALDGVAVQILKHVWELPRPLAVLGPAAVRVVGEPLRAASMPSGHASAAAVLATFLSFRYGRSGAPAVLLALGGGVARVYVGAHWALDIGVGWALGAPFGAAAWALAARVPPLREARAAATRP